MEVMPQTTTTPCGCKVGWKAVTFEREPLRVRYPKESGKRFAQYKVGTSHTATIGDFGSWCSFQSKRSFASATGLKKARERDIKSARYQKVEPIDKVCLPGIHFCRRPGQAVDWALEHGYELVLVIPVAYSPKSIVGDKSGGVIVVYRIKVLG